MPQPIGVVAQKSPRTQESRSKPRFPFVILSQQRGQGKPLLKPQTCTYEPNARAGQMKTTAEHAASGADITSMDLRAQIVLAKGRAIRFPLARR